MNYWLSNRSASLVSFHSIAVNSLDSTKNTKYHTKNCSRFIIGNSFFGSIVRIKDIIKPKIVLFFTVYRPIYRIHLPLHLRHFLKLKATFKRLSHAPYVYFQKQSRYYRVEWKILQIGFLNIVKRFKNNDFMAFFAKNGKFLD